MILKNVYQTLEDRGSDLRKLEQEGPYSCAWENTWLGDGYYFWDTFLENAHWWGRDIRKYQNGYIICNAVCDFNDIKCCDLVGNTEHLLSFSNTYEFLKQQGLADKDTKVKRLIQYLKDINKFNFEAVRAYGIKSKNFHSNFSFNISFEEGRPAYMDLKPAIQICFYSKDSLSLKNYKIVYPNEYTEGYMV
ncbi:hypothetical protein [Wenyingzhuangia sp. 2_MG-2023]|uniref:hypothetical protein n=1 Tax=Wenyingzhuangia sp. 2_MG-2023 TaxID=3062639 RepID=UPI0026E3D6CE|nr:hypothetical protein [Wenyingzhuangia sp. 2_MG-2023]MDO6738611.1 hypothetical protein [Wenyingzhuangia sp. 2_MG-2023]